MSTTITAAELRAQGYSAEHCAYVEQRQAEPQKPPGSSEVRTWAAAAGIACPARGRIPAAVLAQYQARQ